MKCAIRATNGCSERYTSEVKARIAAMEASYSTKVGIIAF